MNTVVLPANTDWTPQVAKFAFLGDGTEIKISCVYNNTATQITTTKETFNTVINCIPGQTYRFDKQVTLFF